MSITVTTTWMEHSSGTKFYQIFEFRSKSAKSANGAVATMTHWGSIAKLKAKTFCRPVNGGEHQIKPGVLLETRASEKQKRGYLRCDTKQETREASEAWWTETFGATIKHDLHLQLGLNTAEGEPSSEPDTSIVSETTVTTVRPESWGPW